MGSTYSRLQNFWQVIMKVKVNQTEFSVGCVGCVVGFRVYIHHHHHHHQPETSEGLLTQEGIQGYTHTQLTTLYPRLGYKFNNII
jgi:hypothetical protein